MHLVRLPFALLNSIFSLYNLVKFHFFLDFKSTYKTHAILPFLIYYGISYKVRHFSVMYNQVTVNPKIFAHQ